MFFEDEEIIIGEPSLLVQACMYWNFEDFSITCMEQAL